MIGLLIFVGMLGVLLNEFWKYVWFMVGVWVTFASVYLDYIVYIKGFRIVFIG